MQEQQTQNSKEIRNIEDEIKDINRKRECFEYIFNVFTKFDDINWEEPANAIQEKAEKKKELEATNDKVNAMQEQLKTVQQSLSKLENETIKSKDKEIYQIEQVNVVEANKRRSDYSKLLSKFGPIDLSTFETENEKWLDVNYDNIGSKQNAFQNDIQHQEETDKLKSKRNVKFLT